MKKLFFLLVMVSALITTACGGNKKIDAAHEDFGFVCPQLVLQSGITFGFTGNFPKMKDFANPDFLNENYSIKEVKKTSQGYDVVYKFANSKDAKITADYTIGFLLDKTNKTTSFNHVKINQDGKVLLDLVCPKNAYDQSGMRKLGEFYGAVNECVLIIFDTKKMNDAIN